MQKLKQMPDIHKGRPALVLGGGPSLLPDMQSLSGSLSVAEGGSRRAVLFAVNHHAACLGVESDYMLFMDDPIHHPLLFQTLKDYAGTKLTPNMDYTDVDLRGVPYWNGPSSALPAVYIALYFGCDPVILCGFDCYQGDVMYPHPGEPEHKPVYDRPLEDHLARWARGFQPGVCPGIERVRAVSGPLVDIFGII